LDKKQLKDLKTFWIGAEGGIEYHALMVRAGFKQVQDVKDADIVVFTGGADVNPLLYGELALQETGFSPKRDKQDLEAWRAAKGKFKIGICRGGQFLNVMNGGKLWQHVDGHALFATHKMVDQFSNQEVEVTSTHHQMFRPGKNAIIIGLAREANMKKCERQFWRFKGDTTAVDKFMSKDFEVVYYPKSMSLCFQPHPEFQLAHSTREYFYSVLRRIMDGTIEAENAARTAAKATK